MRRILLETAAVLALGSALALAVNALSPEPVTVTKRFEDRELDPRFLTPEETKARFEAGQSIFVDARKPEEFALGHIEGALSLPADDFESSFVRQSASLPKEAEIVAYCGGDECALSRQLADKLQGLGYKVRIFRGGWKEWKARNWPAG